MHTWMIHESCNADLSGYQDIPILCRDEIYRYANMYPTSTDILHTITPTQPHTSPVFSTKTLSSTFPTSPSFLSPFSSLSL